MYGFRLTVVDKEGGDDVFLGGPEFEEVAKSPEVSLRVGDVPVLLKLGAVALVAPEGNPLKSSDFLPVRHVHFVFIGVNRATLSHPPSNINFIFSQHYIRTNLKQKVADYAMGAFNLEARR